MTVESDSSASTSPTASAITIAITAIWRLIRNASSRNRALFSVHSHSQLSGLKRYSIAQRLIA